MKTRLVAVAILATLVVAGVGASATLYVAAGTPEQVVEGHTVFAVISNVGSNTTTAAQFGAAVAVLVRDIETSGTVTRFPGVLWFNDQYLVKPSAGAPPSDSERGPCTGAVLAVNAGDSDPRLDFQAATPAYVESYQVTDPNDHSWVVDKWSSGGATPHPIWVVGVANTQSGGTVSAGIATPDDGTSNCSPYSDNPCGGPDVLPVVEDGKTPVYNDSGSAESRSRCFLRPNSPTAAPDVSSHKTTGDNGYGYPCGGKDSETPPASCGALRYNALLFFFLDDLTQAGTPKDHTKGSADWSGDASGCQSPTTDQERRNSGVEGYPCPGGDDNRRATATPTTPA